MTLQRGSNGLAGLGMYPTLADGVTPNPCYDTDRPSWLPYWIDDFTESGCKYPGGLSQTAAAMAAPVGSVVGGIIGGVANAAIDSTINPMGTGDPNQLHVPWTFLALAALGFYAISTLKGHR